MTERLKYLHEDVPVPKRTRTRRKAARRQAEIRRNAQIGEDSDHDSHESPYDEVSVQDSDNDSPESQHHEVLIHDRDYESNQSVLVPECEDVMETGVDDIIDDNNSDRTDLDSQSDAGNPLPSEDDHRGFNSPPHLDAGYGNANGRVHLNDPLCPCTTTTEGDALLMTLALGVRHGMSWTAMVDILTMVNKLFNKNVVPASKYFILKHFDTGKGSTVIHLYCPTCECYLGTKEQVRDEEILHCNNCEDSVKPLSKNSSYFVSVKMSNQLKTLMEDPVVAQEITTYRIERRRHNEEAFEDVYDGRLYKQLCEPGQPLSDPLNFSVTINTDGMALGESSDQSAWPIFLHVNELSPNNRKKHIIYAGMWVGKKQPNMAIFLKEFVEDLKFLATEGFRWTNSNGIELTSRVIPILAVLDSGARYKFLNLTSYSGYMGCTFCYQRAVNTVKGRRFDIVLPAAPLRTQESMITDMREAYASRNDHNPKNRVIRGCHGFSPLVKLHPYLDLGAGVVVDYMHNALLGVTKTHIQRMLSTPGMQELYIGDPEHTFTINQRLLKIRPPTSITRTPRELMHVKKYTASEWRSFLLFYGLVCLDGQVARRHLAHFGLLSSAFYILLQASITNEQLNLANQYLEKYVLLTQEYFGVESMVYNIHLLLHVTKAVRDWGPIWAYSTFVFEGENHYLAKMHTSSGRVALQLTRRYLTFKSYPKLCEQYASSEEPLNYIASITGKRFASYVRCEETMLIGKGLNYTLNVSDLACIRAIEQVQEEALSFQRVIHRKIRYCTRQYSIGKKNDDSWIKIRDGKRGFISSIFYCHTGLEYVVLIIFQQVELDPETIFRTENLQVRHIKKIMQDGPVRAIRPQDIVAQCMNMETDNGHFIADIPYGCYGD